MEFLEKIIYVSPAPRKYLWLVGNQLPHLQTTDQKNRENPTTQSNMGVLALLGRERAARAFFFGTPPPAALVV